MNETRDPVAQAQAGRRARVRWALARARERTAAVDWTVDGSPGPDGIQPATVAAQAHSPSPGLRMYQSQRHEAAPEPARRGEP